MTAQRLSLAKEAGFFDWPEGRVVAFRPSSELQGLPLERCQIVHGFRPDFTAWERRGAETQPVVEGQFSAAYVAVPRSKEYGRALFAEALARVGPGGLVLVDGQKSDGVESLAKVAKQVLVDADSFAKAHGKLIWGYVPETLPDLPQGVSSSPDGWETALSGFSANAVDAGSAMLAGHFPPGLHGDVVDLGAGWGYLAKSALSRSEVAMVDLVEAEYDSLEAARRNIEDPRARFLWEDAAVFAPGKRYDAVLCNPPFHTSRKADPALGQMFLRTAARLLKPSGVLALVANRHLPYETTLSDCFADTRTITEANGYKIVHARRPRQNGAARAS